MTANLELVPRKIEAAPAKPAEPLPLPDAAPLETVEQALAGWAAAWSAKDFPRYRGYYAKSFIPENGRTPEQWASERAIRLGKPGDITIGITDLKVDTTQPDKAVTEFLQSYTSPDYRDVTAKRIDWVRDGNRWKIQREQVLGTPKVSLPQLMKTKKKRVRKPKNC
jgi:ketosteroid isomerase-like protein